MTSPLTYEQISFQVNRQQVTPENPIKRAECVVIIRRRYLYKDVEKYSNFNPKIQLY